MSTSSGDRRASPREGVDYPVRLDAIGGTSSGRLTSLSRLGALVILDRSLVVGTSLTVTLELPEGGGSVTLRGQVIRQEPAGEAHALGILFAPLATETVARIEALLSA